MRPPITRVPSPSPFAATIGFSAAVRAGDLVLVSGQTAVDPDGHVVGGEDAYLQAREALRKIGAALEQTGADLDQVVQTRMYLTRPEDWPEVGRAHEEAFRGNPPAATMVVTALLDGRMLVEIEAVAYVGPGM